MEGDLIKIHEWLLPLSWLYGLGVGFRNKLFDIGILSQKAYDIPIISVGNITVGGTGKTPHVEYLVRMLDGVVKVAVLSRGYKRKTKGYVLADRTSLPLEIGDEPFQIKHKFPNIYVAVDGNRREGIDRLTHDESTKDVDVILLDDAFQHRYVKPGINILLVDYHRLIIYDKLLPAGRLREPLSGKRRADIVIVTKCPKDLKPMEIRVLTKALDLYPYQKLYFTYIDYDKEAMEKVKGKNVLLLTGIGSPKQMENDLKGCCLSVSPMAYADHHTFRKRDVEKISKMFSSMATPKVIVTTEKDAARLQEINELGEEIMANIIVLPIRVRFMLGQGELFNEKIISYVRKNSRNSILVKDKDARASHDSNNLGNRPGTISFRDN